MDKNKWSVILTIKHLDTHFVRLQKKTQTNNKNQYYNAG